MKPRKKSGSLRRPLYRNVFRPLYTTLYGNPGSPPPPPADNTITDEGGAQITDEGGEEITSE